MSLEEKQVLKTKICCSCHKEKSINQYYKCTTFRDGYMSRCKICQKLGIKCKTKTRYQDDVTGRYKLLLHRVEKKDYKETYEFLQKIGYSLERDIHEQFCEKYNLPKKKRLYDKSVRFSPQDLGLV